MKEKRQRQHPSMSDYNKARKGLEKRRKLFAEAERVRDFETRNGDGGGIVCVSQQRCV